MHSTLTALIDITDNWYLNIDDGLTNAILFIDFKKAFDTIDHEILRSKLEPYGFKGACLNFSETTGTSGTSLIELRLQLLTT